MKKYYSRIEIEQESRRLINEFENACQIYKLTLDSRESNRAKKEIIRGNSRGTNMHKFQCNFAWILNDLLNGPTCLAHVYISKGEEIISHINDIANA